MIKNLFRQGFFALGVLLLLVGTTLVVSAAEDATITPEREHALFAQVDEMLATLEEMMSLEVRRPIERAILTREQVRELIESRLTEETKPDEIRLDELFLKKFGLVDGDFDLAQQTVDVLAEQATALYDFKTKRLYLATWTEPDLQEFALIHELVHALQDQHFNLRKYVEQAKGADGDLARMAVVEGQAQWVMTEYVLRESGNSLAENRLMAVAAASASRFEAGRYPVFSSSPLFIRESLLFPYTQGLLFQQALVEKLGKEGFTRAFRQPPASSQQIFDPESYLEARQPTKPRLPKVKPGRGFRRVAQGDVGQLDHFVLLKLHIGDEAAEDLAPKWRGGRYVLFENRSKDRSVLAYSVEWASAEDAAQYLDYYKTICEKKDKGVRFLRQEPNAIVGTGESGGFVLSRSGARVTSIEGLSNDKLE